MPKPLIFGPFLRSTVVSNENETEAGVSDTNFRTKIFDAFKADHLAFLKKS